MLNGVARVILTRNPVKCVHTLNSRSCSQSIAPQFVCLHKTGGCQYDRDLDQFTPRNFGTICNSSFVIWVQWGQPNIMITWQLSEFSLIDELRISQWSHRDRLILRPTFTSSLIFVIVFVIESKWLPFTAHWLVGCRSNQSRIPCMTNNRFDGFGCCYLDWRQWNARIFRHFCSLSAHASKMFDYAHSTDLEFDVSWSRSTMNWSFMCKRDSCSEDVYLLRFWSAWFWTSCVTGVNLSCLCGFV